MNAKQKKEVQEWITTLEVIKTKAGDMMTDEECKFDNMPEGLQESEKGDAIQEAIDHLDTTINSLEEALDELNEII